MKNSPRSARALLAALTLLALASLSLAAAASRPAESLLKIDLDGVVARPGGNVSLAEAGKVKPGEVITWGMKITNRGDSATVPGTSAEGEIHPATVYVPGSAGGDNSAAVTFSLDGRNFSPRPMVKYVENGVERERPAPVEAYRAVRFTWPGQISPGEVRSATYKARVR